MDLFYRAYFQGAFQVYTLAVSGLTASRSVTWWCLTRTIHVGGTMRAAWAPIGQGSSICCSMKQETLLWYWERGITMIMITGIYGAKIAWDLSVFFPKHTHSLFAPGATDGNDLFTVKSKLLLETLDKKLGMINSLHYNKIQLNVKLLISLSEGEKLERFHY